MCVLLSGAISSPERANFGLKQIASDGEREYGSDAAIRTSFEFFFHVDVV